MRLARNIDAIVSSCELALGACRQTTRELNRATRAYTPGVLPSNFVQPKPLSRIIVGCIKLKSVTTDIEKRHYCTYTLHYICLHYSDRSYNEARRLQSCTGTLQSKHSTYSIALTSSFSDECATHSERKQSM